MTDTQTAVAGAGQGEAQPSPDAPHEPSLQEMLSEFESSKPADTKQPQKAEERVAPPSTNGASAEQDDELREWVREQKKQKQAEATDKAVNDALSVMRESADGLSDIPERVLRWAIYGEASTNPALVQAFALREQKPAIWQRALKELASSVEQELMSKPDPKTTADREAARASVRGTTQTKPDPDDAQKELSKKVSTMGSLEFEEFKKGLINR